MAAGGRAVLRLEPSAAHAGSPTSEPSFRTKLVRFLALMGVNYMTPTSLPLNGCKKFTQVADSKLTDRS